MTKTLDLDHATPDELATAGSNFLDMHRPDWMDHLNIDELDMADNCILDQVPVPEGWAKRGEGYAGYLDWHDGMTPRGFEHMLPAFNFGYCLEQAWRREVNRRILLATSTEC